jgi:GNAT superfamily N-acetyltransferase
LYEIFQTNLNSPQAEALYTLLVQEWSDLPVFEAERNGVSIPDPVVVLDREVVIGGASFTRYVGPDSQKTEIWLNALLVEPHYRKQGVASSVIEYLHQLPHPIYALTDVPKLYTKCGWSILISDEQGSVVKQLKA